jgi:hypothetical protein
MARLPRNIRLPLALRRVLDITNDHAVASFYDAGFDAGEFSGPAHATAEERETRAACTALRIREDLVRAEIDRLMHAEPEAGWDDPSPENEEGTCPGWLVS